MKHKGKFLLTSFGLLILSVIFFLWMEEQYTALPPVPSVTSGYYEDAFTLKLSAGNGGKIYYTTDGSTPTLDALLYVDGIEITDRSQEPNIYNSIPNVVKDWKKRPLDETPVPKGTVIRAMYVNPWGIQSDVLTQTYFVGIPAPETGYTISLVFEEKDVFGANGIYVTGSKYDEWYCVGNASTPEPTANFEEHTEVGVTAEIMGLNGEILNQPVGLRIQGNSTRASRKKRFILVAREKYNGKNVFDGNLFDSVSTHSVMLKDAIPDLIIPDLAADRSVAVQRNIPASVYLNGEFWYKTYILERYDEQYFRQYFQVDDRVQIRDGDMDEESVETFDTDFYRTFRKWVEQADFSDPQAWDQLLEQIDLQSYIDYLVINYYLGNTDFGDTHNYILWRSPFLGPGEYEDMRYRWCIYDVDILGRDGVEVNTFSSGRFWEIQKMGIYRSIKCVPAFREQFVLSFMDILNNNFAPKNVEPVLEKYGQTLDWMDGYFRERPRYAVQHLTEEFDLTGSLETVLISSRNPEMGTVTVNTSTIDLSSGAWSGRYFTDYPITVTAAPKPGFRFVGWRGSSDETASSLTLPVDGGLTLEAVFAPI